MLIYMEEKSVNWTLTNYVNCAIWLDYKCKDKNAMYVYDVLEPVGSPAVLCK